MRQTHLTYLRRSLYHSRSNPRTALEPGRRWNSEKGETGHVIIHDLKKSKVRKWGTIPWIPGRRWCRRPVLEWLLCLKKQSSTGLGADPCERIEPYPTPYRTVTNQQPRGWKHRQWHPNDRWASEQRHRRPTPWPEHSSGRYGSWRDRNHAGQNSA